MSFLKKIKTRTERRAFRVRNAQVSRGEKIRISVHRTLNHIYAQAIDDKQGLTVASCSSLALEKVKGDKKDIAKTVGLELGKLLAAQKQVDVFFDRGAYLYHGRVKALAEGLRESGLNF